MAGVKSNIGDLGKVLGALRLLSSEGVSRIECAFFDCGFFWVLKAAGEGHRSW